MHLRVNSGDALRHDCLRHCALRSAPDHDLTMTMTAWVSRRGRDVRVTQAMPRLILV